MISKVGWGHCVLFALRVLWAGVTPFSCFMALSSAPQNTCARVLLLRALVLNHYLISLCADGASARVQLNCLALAQRARRCSRSGVTFACGACLAGFWLGALAAARAAWLLRAVHASLGSDFAPCACYASSASGSIRALLLMRRRDSCVRCTHRRPLARHARCCSRGDVALACCDRASLSSELARSLLLARRCSSCVRCTPR